MFSSDDLECVLNRIARIVSASKEKSVNNVNECIVM